MATKTVATDGDVQATASASTASTKLNATGKWTAGSVSYSTYDKLIVGGKKVAYEASCTFSYSGADNSSGATVTDSETVTLTAGATILQHGASKVLVDGDSQTGPNGNQLTVSASKKLKTG